MKNAISAILMLALFSLSLNSLAQNIGISDVSHTPNESAVLDVYSTSKGILIPRITDSTAITTPIIDGLFAYFTTTSSFWYYKANKWCELSVLIDDSLKHGGANDYLAIGPDGFLILQGAATAFEDLRTPVSSLQKKGVSPDDIAILSNLMVPGFDASRTEEVYFMVQLPHSYKEGSTIYPHIHWIKIGSGSGDSVVWKLDYTWANANSVFPSTTTLSSTAMVSGTVNTHQITSFTGITGTGQKISSMLICRLYREGGNTSDSYSGDAGLLEVDFHFEVNTLGSNQEYIK